MAGSEMFKQNVKAGFTASASDPSGVLSVTVNSSGELTQLSLSDEAYLRYTPTELADQVLRVFTVANSRVQAKAHGLTAPATVVPKQDIERLTGLNGEHRELRSGQSESLIAEPTAPLKLLKLIRAEATSVQPQSSVVWLSHASAAPEPTSFTRALNHQPARQLPAPSPDVDYIAGLRFLPADNPETTQLSTSQPDVEEDMDRAHTESNCFGLSASHSTETNPEPKHDPHGGMSEQEWTRLYLGGQRENSVPEYAWPPGALFPEGGEVPGQPVMLPSGAIVDRFGPHDGRIFAPRGTAFAERALPPSYLEAEYRQYRVLKPLSVVRAVSASWFGQRGGGVRYRAHYAADELVAMGYLEDVTFAEIEAALAE